MEKAMTDVGACELILNATASPQLTSISRFLCWIEFGRVVNDLLLRPRDQTIDPGGD